MEEKSNHQVIWSRRCIIDFVLLSKTNFEERIKIDFAVVTKVPSSSHENLIQKISRKVHDFFTLIFIKTTQLLTISQILSFLHTKLRLYLFVFGFFIRLPGFLPLLGTFLFHVFTKNNKHLLPLCVHCTDGQFFLTCV